MIDGIVDNILVDTNELQTNQGNWATAIGFATETKQDIIDANLDSVKSTVDTNLDAKVSEVSGGATAQQVWEYATRGLTEEVTTDSASREASKADLTDVALEATSQSILSDTDELQSAGLATEANATANKKAILARVTALS